MNEYKITLKPLKIDDLVFFLGTDEEIAQAERQEAARAAEVEKIIFCDNFRAMEHTTSSGQRRILHHSTRHGINYQLSYIDPDGVPAMHENYIKTGEPQERAHIGSKSELLRHYVIESHEGMELLILTD